MRSTSWSGTMTRRACPIRCKVNISKDCSCITISRKAVFPSRAGPWRRRISGVPVFAVGTEKDHVAPWKSVFKIHLMVGGDVTFALTSGGHNAGIVSEPGHRGRSYRCWSANPASRFWGPEQWSAAAELHQGSWWEPWRRGFSAILMIKQGNAQGPANARGAPGTYVLNDGKKSHAA